jgi:hypothetical protein
MTESLPSLSDFENILLDRIEELRGRIHKAHNPIYLSADSTNALNVEECGFLLLPLLSTIPLIFCKN